MQAIIFVNPCSIQMRIRQQHPLSPIRGIFPVKLKMLNRWFLTFLIIISFTHRRTIFHYGMFFSDKNKPEANLVPQPKSWYGSNVIISANRKIHIDTTLPIRTTPSGCTLGWWLMAAIMPLFIMNGQPQFQGQYGRCQNDAWPSDLNLISIYSASIRKWSGGWYR
jgi:hypothetical protein